MNHLTLRTNAEKRYLAEKRRPINWPYIAFLVVLTVLWCVALSYGANTAPTLQTPCKSERVR